MSDLDSRLEVLREAGWSLTSRETFKLSRPDRDNSVRSFHGEELEELVRRVEAATLPKPKSALPPGWVALTPVEPRPGETVHSAERLFENDPKPVRQSAATEAGLLRACRSYDEHRAASVTTGTVIGVDPETALRLRASSVHTGLSSTGNY
jgi:hypothetical protein